MKKFILLFLIFFQIFCQRRNRRAAMCAASNMCGDGYCCMFSGGCFCSHYECAAFCSHGDLIHGKSSRVDMGALAMKNLKTSPVVEEEPHIDTIIEEESPVFMPPSAHVEHLHEADDFTQLDDVLNHPEYGFHEELPMPMDENHLEEPYEDDKIVMVSPKIVSKKKKNVEKPAFGDLYESLLEFNNDEKVNKKMHDISVDSRRRRAMQIKQIQSNQRLVRRLPKGKQIIAYPFKAKNQMKEYFVKAKNPKFQNSQKSQIYKFHRFTRISPQALANGTQAEMEKKELFHKLFKR